MGKHKPIIYNALLLTSVNLLLRFATTAFQVFLSGRIGAEGVGLLQLVLSVGALSLTVGMGGIRTATMYLCADAIGRKQKGSMVWVLSGCILYSIILSTAVSGVITCFAHKIAASWIGDARTVGAIRLLAGFLPVNCLCGVMIGYFTAENRIRTLAGVEIAEQLFSIIITILLLRDWAGDSISKSCTAVILGSGFGACGTLISLLIIKGTEHTKTRKYVSIRKELWNTAVPLAIADNTKAGINTIENLMVPKRLALFPRTNNPLEAFGMVCGMVFPVIMFPAAILFGLAELLIPELARCNAAGSTQRIKHITQKSAMIALAYGCFCSGILYLGAQEICYKLYNVPEAGKYLKWYAQLIPVLYADTIIDAITKGLGQQKKCVKYNIITSAMDVILLFILLPRYGMVGYFISFAITHMLNFYLSYNLLTKMVGRIIGIKEISITILSTIACTTVTSSIENKAASIIIFSIMYLAIIYRMEIIDWKEIKPKLFC